MHPMRDRLQHPNAGIQGIVGGLLAARSPDGSRNRCGNNRFAESTVLRLMDELWLG